MYKNQFTTVLGCIDGRIQIPVHDFLINKTKIRYTDTINLPGIIKVISTKDHDSLALIHKTLDISIRIHGSKHIAIVGHYDCAGNPVSKEEQIIQIHQSVNYVKSLYPEAEVIGLWVNENWEVEEVLI